MRRQTRRKPRRRIRSKNERHIGGEPTSNTQMTKTKAEIKAMTPQQFKSYVYDCLDTMHYETKGPLKRYLNLSYDDKVRQPIIYETTSKYELADMVLHDDEIELPDIHVNLVEFQQDITHPSNKTTDYFHIPDPISVEKWRILWLRRHMKNHITLLIWMRYRFAVATMPGLNNRVYC